MKQRREQVDAYAETLVLEPKTSAGEAGSHETDPLALYEEYARELTREAAASRPPSGARPKR